jgi:hypothetical protein
MSNPSMYKVLLIKKNIFDILEEGGLHAIPKTLELIISLQHPSCWG